MDHLKVVTGKTVDPSLECRPRLLLRRKEGTDVFASVIRRSVSTGTFSVNIS